MRERQGEGGNKKVRSREKQSASLDTSEGTRHMRPKNRSQSVKRTSKIKGGIGIEILHA